jgi:hypothetical protein
MRTKRGVLDIIEGGYAAGIVYQLHRSQVFACLDGAKTVEEVAADRGYQPALLRAALDFISETTDVITRTRPGTYRLNPRYLSYRHFGFQLDKFIGAYGSAVDNLEDTLRGTTAGQSLVDRGRLAAAFSQVDQQAPSLSSMLIREWQVDSLLDLGCGPAALLVELGLTESGFRGWGIDRSAEMCAVAIERVGRAGLADRVQIINGDVRSLGEHMGAEMRDQVGALHGSSILNEFFGAGHDEAIGFLNGLRLLYPGRLLFAVDYYGKLGTRGPRSRGFGHTLVQDLAQVMSGQGVPPSGLDEWSAIYDAAECGLLHAYHGTSEGIEWFAHVVRL